MSRRLRLARLQISARLCCERGVSLRHSTVSAATTATHFPLLSDSSNISKTALLLRLSAASFSTTTSHLKKGAAKAKKAAASSSPSSVAHIPDNKAQANRDRDIDPYDFSELEANIKHHVDRLREGLQKLRSGGRLSPETIEALPVELKHGLGGEGGAGKKVERLKLRDLATVVPRGGRVIAVMLNDEAHLKPITTTIQSSPYSLTPHPDPQNPQHQLNIPIPPPTAESRALALADAKTQLERAGTGIREARAQWQKWYRRAEKEKLVIRDELEKAHKRMEAVVEKGQKTLRAVYDGAVNSGGF